MVMIDVENPNDMMSASFVRDTLIYKRDEVFHNDCGNILYSPEEKECGVCRECK